MKKLILSLSFVIAVAKTWSAEPFPSPEGYEWSEHVAVGVIKQANICLKNGWEDLTSLVERGILKQKPSDDFNIPKESLLPGFPNQVENVGTKMAFPEDEVKVAVVGGTQGSGLGVLNTKKLGFDKDPLYLINKEREEGVHLVMNWKDEEVPEELYNTFDVVLLEQILPKNLVGETYAYSNAYKLLKPGGIFLCLGYGPQSYMILNINDKQGEYNLEKGPNKLLDMQNSKFDVTGYFIHGKLANAGFDPSCCDSIKDNTILEEKLFKMPILEKNLQYQDQWGNNIYDPDVHIFYLKATKQTEIE